MKEKGKRTIEMNDKLIDVRTQEWNNAVKKEAIKENEAVIHRTKGSPK